MACCGGGNKSDDEACEEFGGIQPKHVKDVNEKGTFVWHPTIKNVEKIAYVRQLEKRYEKLQSAYFNLSTELARLQFYLKKIIQADACDRLKLIEDIKRKGIEKVECQTFASLEQCDTEMGSLHRKQHLLMNSLKRQIGSFQVACENFDKKEEAKSQHLMASETSLKTTQCTICKVKETPSVKITKYTGKDQAATTSTSRQNMGPAKGQQDLKKLKSKTKLSAKPSKTVKTSEVKKTSSSQKLNKKTEKDAKSKKKAKTVSATNLPSKKSASSKETLCSGQSIISTRSASFKELKAKYQTNPSSGK